MRRIAEYILLILTILSGAIISIFDLIGFLDKIVWLRDEIPAITLLILSSITAYICLENINRKAQLDQLQNLFVVKSKELLSSLDGVLVIPYTTTEEGLEYLAAKFLTAQHSIDQAALAPSAPHREKIGRKYQQATERVLKNPKIKYRYIAIFDGPRWERVKKYILNANTDRYFVKYFVSRSDSVPILSFAIFDDAEVLIRYPYRPGENESWVSITHPEIVNLFASYYSSMWHASIPLDTKDRKAMEEIEQTISIKSKASLVVEGGVMEVQPIAPNIP